MTVENFCIRISVDVSIRFQTHVWTELSRYSVSCGPLGSHSRSEADIHLAQSWISVVLGIAVVVDTIFATVLVVVFHRSRTGVEA